MYKRTKDTNELQLFPFGSFNKRASKSLFMNTVELNKVCSYSVCLVNKTQNFVHDHFFSLINEHKRIEIELFIECFVQLQP